MKKLVLTLSLILGALSVPNFIPESYAQEPVCDPSQPCFYVGEAKTDNGLTLQIKVYESATGNLVATFSSGGKEYTMYVIPGENGTFHINFNGRAYYFKI